jgi:GNAT superfamily N-acetyltransferase
LDITMADRSPATTDINIVCYGSLESGALSAAIEAIFWETTVSPPADAVARAAFRDLWLDQYLRHDPGLAYVALDATSGALAGYLVGCWDNPATSPRFANLAYFQTFAAACDRFPAHLHINLTAACQNRGIGGRLIEAFAAATRDAGYPGVHVVTAGDARNVGFYTRAGFKRITATPRNGRDIVFLGRELGP